MPDISLDLRVIEFVTEQAVRLRAWRAYVIVEFATQQGPGAQFRCIVDPGAPFSVIPFSLFPIIEGCSGAKQKGQRLELNRCPEVDE